MEHTKGKWVSWEKEVVSFHNKRDWEVICKLQDPSMGSKEANAKLIVATPRMYKYCMERLDLLQKQINVRVGIDNKDMTKYEELKAIKKATE